ncbi:hypothetical protein BpHYR1_044263 [Brachionus plicatilis]|uniref:Uncharacterized protein n=1 Tax=Brachionus plicatilis TaxID=10195 RepID=A0A3M7SVJ2_BRAPC|nr:hypothetical protein BpHYR1_044263 [Brachionus plicatilis]
MSSSVSIILIACESLFEIESSSSYGRIALLASMAAVALMPSAMFCIFLRLLDAIEVNVDDS